ncbi:MAG: family 10 glycosylhydrolase, partial [Eubacteriales bacterium]|nr:family 10 glycosylhydrolase [Eubacteriales bacterium]
AALFIKNNITEGTKVRVDRENLVLYVNEDDDTRKFNFGRKIEEIKKRSEKSGINSDKLIEEIECAYSTGEYDKCKRLLEEAYYITSTTKKGEIRGIWHRPLERSAEEIDACVRRLGNAGFNLLLIETIYDGFSIGKRCSYMPLRKDLADNDFDMIDEYIKACRKYRIKIHAWVEDFFVGSEHLKTSDSCGSPVIDEHPEWAARKKDGTIYMHSEPGFIYLNAALPEVRGFLNDMYREMLDEYGFDGIQLDYIRYPVTTSVDESVGFDEYSVKAFFDSSGIDIRTVGSTDCMEWDKFVHWCAENVTIFVKMMYDLIREYKNNGRELVLSTAVFGDPEAAIKLKSQDWRLWCKKGWLDWIFPMAYLSDAGDVYKEVKYMVDNYRNVPNISGIAPMYNKLNVIESTKQVEACRDAGASGVAFFAAHNLTDEQIDKLKTGVFRE